ncbi:phage terminase small subunit [Shewanella dokdonensis]|uniref:Terminase n=1 Tax=Shewanella dokdonensis TaxID=712036 RepID=A0ABX8DBN4_9GAMM|nr:phage terminase small subunit [Shewanella dokdonensis]MCL1074819.1 phage terminase small subunit [Shewanella dokdonensis]QVK22210.1 terminase [Shewanella dokdonensis]
MMSPAQAHRDRVLAAKRGGDNPALDQKALNQYELMLMQLTEHRRALKTLQSIDRKIQAKRQFLPQYTPYLDGVLSANRGQQDEVLTTVMLWHIDVGDIAAAIRLGRYAIQHDLTMPDRFERGLPCTFAEEVADVATRLLGSENAVSSALIAEVIAMTTDSDMYDEVRAKLYRAYGEALEAEEQLQPAFDAYQTALKYNDKVGVKKLMEKLGRTLGTSQPDSGSHTAS